MSGNSRMAGKVVLVTGGGAGIGQGTATRLAAEGALVVITDANVDAGLSTVDEITRAGGNAVFKALDVTNEGQWQTTVESVGTEFGRLDALVNCAGIYIIAPLTETTLEDWNLLMGINVTGTFLGMKHSVPLMITSGGGSIINLSSIAANVGVPGHALYGASKGAVRTMTKDVAAEFAASNVRANSVHPTYTKTAMASYGAAALGTTIEAMAPSMSPLGRIAEVSDVVHVILLLASDEGSYLTGGEYLVDGGSLNLTIPAF